MEPSLCTHCGSTGRPRRHVRGSFLTELVLWLLFIVPGVIYSIWRLASAEYVCPRCGTPHMIPLDSPVAIKITGKDPRPDC